MEVLSGVRTSGRRALRHWAGVRPVRRRRGIKPRFCKNPRPYPWAAYELSVENCPMKSRSILGGLAVTAALAVGGCAAIGTAGRVASAAGVLSEANRAPESTAVAPPPGWRVGTEEHVDLWLHGFAMLTSDTGKVTFFTRGYRQEMTALKKQRGVYTNLDANQEKLQQRFAT